LNNKKKLYEQKQREEVIRKEREELLRKTKEEKDRKEVSNKKGFLGFWNTNNPASSKKDEESSVPLRIPDRVVPKPSHSNDDVSFQIELIELLLVSYFKIVRKNIKDRIPKTIMFFMVNASKEKIQNELVKSLYKEDLFGTLLEESDDIAQRREQLRETIEVLSAAQRILNEIVDFKIN